MGFLGRDDNNHDVKVSVLLKPSLDEPLPKEIVHEPGPYKEHRKKRIPMHVYNIVREVMRYGLRSMGESGDFYYLRVSDGKEVAEVRLYAGRDITESEKQSIARKNPSSNPFPISSKLVINYNPGGGLHRYVEDNGIDGYDGYDDMIRTILNGREVSSYITNKSSYFRRANAEQNSIILEVLGLIDRHNKRISTINERR